MTIILIMALYAMWWGFGKVTGFWGGDTKERKEGSGMNAQKIIATIVIVAFGLMFLSAPGADKVIDGTLQAAINNLIFGVQPLVRFATEVVAVIVIGYVIYLFARRNWRQ